MIRKMAIVFLCLLATAAPALSAQHEFLMPDEKDLAVAVKTYQDGFHSHAVEKFQHAARWGNKQAQLHLAVLNFEGVGTEVNIPLAHAWARLASSLGDSKAKAAKDEIWGLLTDAGREQAGKEYEKLLEDYSDAEALKRRERWVRQQRNDITGSHLGRPTASVRMQVPTKGGRTITTTAKDYFEVVDAFADNFRDEVGRVELGEFKVLDEEG